MSQDLKGEYDSPLYENQYEGPPVTTAILIIIGLSFFIGVLFLVWVLT